MKKKHNLKNLPTLLPATLPWSEFFQNDHLIDVEIGCGRTHFLFERARNYLDRNIVGIEWKYEFIEQANRKILREMIPNVAAFHGNAWLLVPLLFGSKTISQVFVNFPDPWWKLRHKKRLVLNEVFLSALAPRMKDDGFILLQTDVLELFLSYQSLIHEQGCFKQDTSMSEEEIIAQTKAKTHREKKCLEEGLPIYRGVFRLTTKL